MEDDLSDGPSESQIDGAASTDTADRTYLEDKCKQKRVRCEVRLQGIKDIINDKKNKKPDATSKDSSLQKLKSLTSKNKDEAAPHSDSSDSSTLLKKSKSKGQEGTSATPKAPSSSASSSSSSSVTAAGSTKGKDDEPVKEEVLGQKDATGSINLFEKFLLNCEAKDRAPRRQPPHPPPTEKTSSKPNKVHYCVYLTFLFCSFSKSNMLELDSEFLIWLRCKKVEIMHKLQYLYCPSLTPHCLNFSSFYVFLNYVFIADWKNRKDSEVEQRLSTSESRDEEVGEEQATRWYA